MHDGRGGYEQMCGNGGGGMGGGGEERGARGGGLGVGEGVSGGTLTVAPLGGPGKEPTVLLDDDTDVYTRGDAGPMEMEEGDAGDIKQGAIVMIHGAPIDASSEGGSGVEGDACSLRRATTSIPPRTPRTA